MTASMPEIANKLIILLILPVSPVVTSVVIRFFDDADEFLSEFGVSGEADRSYSAMLSAAMSICPATAL